VKRVVSDRFSVVSFQKKERQKIAPRRRGRGDFAEKKLSGEGAGEGEKRKQKTQN
jgi:hypothetical protein